MAPVSDATSATAQFDDPSRPWFGRQLFDLPPHLVGLITGTLDMAMSRLGSEGHHRVPDAFHRSTPWIIVDRSRTRC